jgi:hypothetical protein
MSPVCKMADNGRLTVHQKVKIVPFCAETNSSSVTNTRVRLQEVVRQNGGHIENVLH